MTDEQTGLSIETQSALQRDRAGWGGGVGRLATDTKVAHRPKTTAAALCNSFTSCNRQSDIT